MSRLTAFTMPKWGIEMTEGVVAEWMVAEGQAYARGDVLTLVESDKISNEIEAETPGVMCKLVATPGETYPVGALLAVIGDEAAAGDEIEAFVSAFKPAGAAGDVGAQQTAAVPAPVAQPAAKAAPAPVSATPPAGLAISPAAWRRSQELGVDVASLRGSERKGRISLQDVEQAARPARAVGGGQPVSIALSTTHLDVFFATPLAKRLAVIHGVDLAKVKATGSRGRISKADVLQLVELAVPAAPPAPPPGADVEVVPMSMMRKAIARQLTLSKTTIPHFYLRMSVRIDALQAMRQRARESVGQAPSVNDYLVRACALALAANPDVNVQVHGDTIHRFRHADISVAVATDKGLVTPVVTAAETKSVAKISAEIAELAKRAREGKLKAEEFQGGSFSLSNLGMFGIDQFDAIINPPQGAILAVGAAQRRPVESEYTLSFATMVQLSLSCDHRAIDGAVGARFMAELRRLIESPELLVAG
jgi:pyruvate dehydrogenase E2 component (dihydrolipoamide acetyltransferase)